MAYAFVAWNALLVVGYEYYNNRDTNPHLKESTGFI